MKMGPPLELIGVFQEDNVRFLLTSILSLGVECIGL